MGSGEMGPRMRRVHRAVIRRLAEGRALGESVRAVIIDTPYGFEENGPALSAAALEFFGALGTIPSLASFRRDDALASETSLARIRAADLVFSGPGSPTYALRQWSGTPMAGALAAKLTGGGALVAASAAALCLGRFTVPVYEIYKVGADPHWQPGLDVLSAIGLNAAVVPHWDNAEGASFDTRYCWLGERRMLELESQLPVDTQILGIDEHTALWIDIDSDTATIHGRGSVTVRRAGSNRVIASPETIALSELRQRDTPVSVPRPASRTTAPPDAPTDIHSTLAARILELEQNVARASDRAQLVEPLVQALLELRGQAREMAAYDVADGIRDRLVALGIEVIDTLDGKTTFRVRGP